MIIIKKNSKESTYIYLLLLKKKTEQNIKRYNFLTLLNERPIIIIVTEKVARMIDMEPHNVKENNNCK